MSAASSREPSRLLMFGMGALFGALLSKAEATHHAKIADLFLFRDLHLAIVMGVAIGTASIGIALLKRRARPLLGGPWEVTPKSRKPWQFGFGLVFGVGWALSGTCPGTALAQLGEGAWTAAVVVAGMLTGTWMATRKGG